MNEKVMWICLGVVIVYLVFRLWGMIRAQKSKNNVVGIPQEHLLMTARAPNTKAERIRYEMVKKLREEEYPHPVDNDDDVYLADLGMLFYYWEDSGLDLPLLADILKKFGIIMDLNVVRDEGSFEQFVMNVDTLSDEDQANS